MSRGGPRTGAGRPAGARDKEPRKRKPGVRVTLRLSERAAAIVRAQSNPGGWASEAIETVYDRWQPGGGSSSMTTKANMTADDLIQMSIREDRIVTEYPETREAFASLCEDLACRADDSADISGAGHSGPEARGGVEWWGESDDGEWRVHVVAP